MGDAVLGAFLVERSCLRSTVLSHIADTDPGSG